MTPQEKNKKTDPAENADRRAYCARQLRTVRARSRSTEDPSEKERADREVRLLRERVQLPS